MRSIPLAWILFHSLFQKTVFNAFFWNRDDKSLFYQVISYPTIKS